jgi:hypothetical protein
MNCRTTNTICGVSGRARGINKVLAWYALVRVKNVNERQHCTMRASPHASAPVISPPIVTRVVGIIKQKKGATNVAIELTADGGTARWWALAAGGGLVGAKLRGRAAVPVCGDAHPIVQATEIRFSQSHTTSTSQRVGRTTT